MKQIKSKDMIKKIKQMKKDGIKFEDVMFYVLYEMMDKKSSQIIMDMSNNNGEKIKLIVAITDENGEIETEKEQPITNATRSMVC